MASKRVQLTITDQRFFDDAQNKREAVRVWSLPWKLPYYIESWDSQNERAKVWAKVPKIPANGSVDLYIYYGNPPAVSESNPEAVFDFYDDFEDGVIDDKWDVSNLASAVEQDGYLITEANPNTWYNYDSAAIASVSIAGNFYAEAKLTYLHRSSDIGELYLRLEGDSGYAQAGLRDAWVGELPIYNASVNDTGSSSGKVSDEGTIVIKIYRIGDSVTARVEGETTVEVSETLAGVITSLKLTNTRYGSSKGKTAKWDYVIVRKYADITVTVGEEEASDVSGWLYRRKITIINPNNYDLYHFQVAIDLDGSNFDFLKANSDGSDIRITYGLARYSLPYYIETWDTSTPQAVIWVGIDSETKFYIELNPANTTDESDPTIMDLPEATNYTLAKFERYAGGG